MARVEEGIPKDILEENSLENSDHIKLGLNEQEILNQV
jgi:hypothetical protein